MQTDEIKARVILAEFFLHEDGRYELRSLYTWSKSLSRRGWGGRLSTYDVDWCRRDGCYLFHMSGTGGKPPLDVSGPYWTPSTRYVREVPCELVHEGARQRNKTARLVQIPVDLQGCEDLLQYLQTHEREETSVFCQTCRDDLPSDDLCAHCWWCDRTEWFSTPQERSRGCRCEACTDGRQWLKEHRSAAKKAAKE